LVSKNVPLAYKPAETTPAKEALPSPYNSALTLGFTSYPHVVDVSYPLKLIPNLKVAEA